MHFNLHVLRSTLSGLARLAEFESAKHRSRAAAHTFDKAAEHCSAKRTAAVSLLQRLNLHVSIEDA